MILALVSEVRDSSQMQGPAGRKPTRGPRQIAALFRFVDDADGGQHVGLLDARRYVRVLTHLVTDPEPRDPAIVTSRRGRSA